VKNLDELISVLCNPDSIWNFIPNYNFSKLGGLPFFLVCNYNIARVPYNLSKFHKQALAYLHGL